MTDTIFLRDLEVETVIGIYEWERQMRQTVRINLEMPTDIAKAAASDAIEDTLNYKAVAKTVIALVEGSSFQLVETMVERIAQRILADFDLDWVRVSVEKPGAVRGSRTVGVSIERQRA